MELISCVHSDPEFCFQMRLSEEIFFCIIHSL